MAVAIEITRRDTVPARLRTAAGQAKDGRVARRMPAVALVLEGVDRRTATQNCGMDRQTLRDRCPAEYVHMPRGAMVENIWHYLRANKLAIAVFDGCADIVNECCDAWNFFAGDPEKIASITKRSWAKVNHQGRWYQWDCCEAVA